MFYYTPNELTIHVGDTVVWINDGGTHDVNGNISSISGESFNNPESFGAQYTQRNNCSVGNHALQGMTVGATILHTRIYSYLI